MLRDVKSLGVAQYCVAPFVIQVLLHMEARFFWGVEPDQGVQSQKGRVMCQRD